MWIDLCQCNSAARASNQAMTDAGNKAFSDALLPAGGGAGTALDMAALAREATASALRSPRRREATRSPGRCRVLRSLWPPSPSALPSSLSRQPCHLSRRQLRLETGKLTCLLTECLGSSEMEFRQHIISSDNSAIKKY